MDQTQELPYGVDYTGIFELLVTDQITECSEIDLRTLQQLVHHHDLLFCAELRGFVRVLQIGSHRIFLRHRLSQDFPHLPQDIVQGFSLRIGG